MVIFSFIGVGPRERSLPVPAPSKKNKPQNGLIFICDIILGSLLAKKTAA